MSVDAQYLYSTRDPHDPMYLQPIWDVPKSGTMGAPYASLPEKARAAEMLGCDLRVLKRIENVLGAQRTYRCAGCRQDKAIVT